MLYPNQFQVNQTWIAIRVNDSIVSAENEPHDIYVLMDAASAYVLGFVISKMVHEAPGEADVEELFQIAWSAKSEWAEELIIPENFSAAEVFTAQAQKHEFTVKTVPLQELDPIIGPLIESFAQSLEG